MLACLTLQVGWQHTRTVTNREPSTLRVIRVPLLSQSSETQLPETNSADAVPAGGPKSHRENPFFRFVVLGSTAFVITVLSMIAGVFAHPDAPVNQWLNRHAMTLLVAEIVVTGTCGLLALVIDRRQALEAQVAGEVIIDDTVLPSVARSAGSVEDKTEPTGLPTEFPADV